MRGSGMMKHRAGERREGGEVKPGRANGHIVRRWSGEARHLAPSRVQMKEAQGRRSARHESPAGG